MNLNELPHYPTAAQITAARDYVRACVAYEPGWETEIPRVDAMPAEQVIEEALRLWADSWDDFCAHFACDIRAAEQDEASRWHAEAAQAARGHLFPSRLPAAALSWGRCTLTAAEAVKQLGADIADRHEPRDGVTWRWIAAILGVPIPVAMAWAVEGRTRNTLAALIRPFRSGSASK